MYEDIPLYGAGLALGIVTAGELKLLVKSADWAKALRKGELVLIKTALGNKILLNGMGSQRLYASFFPIITNLKLEKVVSKNLASVIQAKEPFLRIVKYARKTEYQSSVALLEKAVTEDAAFRQFIHDRPAAIDDFFEYLKNKPGASLNEVVNGVGNITSLLASLEKKFANAELFRAFKNDFGNDVATLAKFESGEISVEAWKVLSPDKVIRNNKDDLEKIANYIKDNPYKIEEVTEGFNKASDKRKWLDDLGEVIKSGASLAEYKNIREYLGDGQIKAYLNNPQANNFLKDLNLKSFEDLLKTADKEVLKQIDECKSVDNFAEIVRGFYDNPSAFTSAIKDVDKFSGNRGWLKFWTLTPQIEESLETIRSLKGKLDFGTGNATDIQLACIQAYTVNGDFLNQPMRYNPGWFGKYNTRALKHIKEGLEELRKVSGRHYSGLTYSGKAYSEADFTALFVGGKGKEVPMEGFVSSAKNLEVAEGFIGQTTKWTDSKTGKLIAVIRRIQSKEGVYIDDLSDWGKNLGPVRHADKDVRIQIQEEVLMNEGYFKQTSEPIPVIENGIHKEENGILYYFVDFEELVKPLN